LVSTAAHAALSDEDLAKIAQNPVGNLISVPFQDKLRDKTRQAAPRSSCSYQRYEGGSARGGFAAIPPSHNERHGRGDGPAV
jgi:hypothetical protein